MTELPSLRTHADTQLTSVAALPGTFAHTNGALALDTANDDEESSTIKCICEFTDDDGATVLCERCNTWQHIACYYGVTNPDGVPEIHECIDCVPRPVDKKRAIEIQRDHRLRQAESKPRRPATKSHKKKIKDPVTGAVQSNGWPLSDKQNSYFAIDRKSGSPRDQQPPPNKRPKTNHKPSGSVASLSHQLVSISHSRKRASSTVHSRQSPTKSPITPGLNGSLVEYYAPEFMQLCRQQNDFRVIEANLLNDIGVTNDLFSWLKDPEALAAATNGRSPSEVFQRSDLSMDELAETAPNIVKEAREDKGVVIEGNHPVHQFLTVESQVPKGNYIGELKGHVGRKEEYFQIHSNRWATLRHPEPFVFFPPHLPIYIDARREGTDLRYVRRSCAPNLEMRVFIVDGNEWHFCFLSKTEIHPGEEITIPWEIHESVRDLLSSSLANGQFKNEGISQANEELARWSARVLANFGGCACNRPLDECAMRKFAYRRSGRQISDQTTHTQKSSRKAKKQGTQVSPLSTGRATNSRAGSEAVMGGDKEEDNADSRSTSGSAHSKVASRDITPATHVSGDTAAGIGVEMSDREKRKFLQEQKLFEQMENEPKRRKRNSGGSTLNTPNVTTSVGLLKDSTRNRPMTNTQQKQLGFPDPPVLLPTNLKDRTSESHIPRNHKHGQLNGRALLGKHSTQTHNANGVARHRSELIVRPVYTDSSVQTDQDANEKIEFPPKKRKKHTSSLRNMLLRQTTEMHAYYEDRQQPLSTNESAKDEAMTDVGYNDISTTAASDAQVTDGLEQLQHPSEDSSLQVPPVSDVEMENAAEDQQTTKPGSGVNGVDIVATKSTDEKSSDTSHPPIQPPAPPWSSKPSSPTMPGPEVPQLSRRSYGLQVELPPVPTFSTQSPTTPSAASTLGENAGAHAAVSPSGPGSQLQILSPSITNPTISTPRQKIKKMSLSEYKARSQKKGEALFAASQSDSLRATSPTGIISHNSPGSMLRPPESLAVEDSTEQEHTVPSTEPLSGHI
ncbi:hypothetical protein M501DRAFT_1008638 [Patellaria atrata CBS 101060]|uniref:SET domain-containing protein n=1 Tax=Patellaria atrata CBS 101060 TaxID=1346257 RepID=A0A9P4S2U1_9PEZI|nr:hypothetical protein M501DRAFT_1008638 [Patellaria atrata CBS 101060]